MFGLTNPTTGLVSPQYAIFVLAVTSAPRTYLIWLPPFLLHDPEIRFVWIVFWSEVGN